MSADNQRRLAWDWFPGSIPENVSYDPSAYFETTYSFQLCRSRENPAIRVGRASSFYLGVMFDLGPSARVTIGDYALLHGVRIICDSELTIGDYCLLSWNVVIMDSYRLPLDRGARASELRSLSARPDRRPTSLEPSHPVRIERNVWIGFDACVLPGVTIGEGSIVGARSVVNADVPPFTVVAGNPARIIRRLSTNAPRDPEDLAKPGEMSHG